MICFFLHVCLLFLLPFSRLQYFPLMFFFFGGYILFSFFPSFILNLSPLLVCIWNVKPCLSIPLTPHSPPFPVSSKLLLIIFFVADAYYSVSLPYLSFVSFFIFSCFNFLYHRFVSFSLSLLLLLLPSPNLLTRYIFLLTEIWIPSLYFFSVSLFSFFTLHIISLMFMLYFPFLSFPFLSFSNSQLIALYWKTNPTSFYFISNLVLLISSFSLTSSCCISSLFD